MDNYDEMLSKSQAAVEVTIKITIPMGGPRSWEQVWSSNWKTILATVIDGGADLDNVSFKEAEKNEFDPETDKPWR